MSKKALVDVLKENGFKNIHSWHKGTLCYENKDNKWYAEVYEYTKGHYECWVVGEGVPNNGTISYPGGSRKHEAEDLQILFDKINR